MDPQYRTDIFPNLVRYGDGSVMPSGLDWADRIAPMLALQDQAGQINNLTVTLTGRPGELHIEGSSVMTVIRAGTGQGAALPQRRSPIQRG